MNKFALFVALSASMFAAGCSLSPVTAVSEDTPSVGNPTIDINHQAVLFVSMEDGSVVRQSITSTADYCFKENGRSDTTCFTEGEAIIDPDSQKVIAHEMIEDRLHLYAGRN